MNSRDTTPRRDPVDARQLIDRALDRAAREGDGDDPTAVAWAVISEIREAGLLAVDGTGPDATLGVLGIDVKDNETEGGIGTQDGR